MTKPRVFWCMHRTATDAGIVSSQSLIILLFFLPLRSLHFSSKFHAAENLTHSFLRPVCLPRSFLHHSSLHRFLFFINCLHRNQTSHTLATISAVTADGSAVSADQDVLQQPLSHQERRSNLLTEEEKKKKNADHFIYHSYLEKQIKLPPAWLRLIQLWVRSNLLYQTVNSGTTEIYRKAANCMRM